MSFRGFTALHYAVLVDDIHAVKALLEAGADPTIKTAAGYLPVDFAQHSPVMKEMLVKASAEVLSSYVTCVLYRVRQKYLTILQNSCEWNCWRGEFVLERLARLKVLQLPWSAGLYTIGLLLWRRISKTTILS